MTFGKGLVETGLGFQLVARAQDSLKVIIEPQEVDPPSKQARISGNNMAFSLFYNKMRSVNPGQPGARLTLQHINAIL
jgi:hypothetical protein